MTSPGDTHNKSMDCAELALLARLRHDHAEADRLFRESLELERAAITEMEADPVEPTFSVLHRSAATLALDCNDPQLAERLIATALSHESPAEIREELRDLLEHVYFRRHLQLRGINLEEDEIQMSLAGEGVGFGVVHSHEFLERVEKASKLIYRIVDRRQGRPFRTKGRLKKAIKNDYEVFLSVPRAASFAVTLKLGRPTAQAKLPGISDTAEVVDEFMNLMGLLTAGDCSALATAIPETPYRTNFVQLGKRLAPDGEDVKIVGFTTMRGGHERFVELSRPRRDIVLPEVTPSEPATERVSVSGTLRFADATHTDRGQIKIVDEQNNVTHNVKVPEGMMGDIVKPLWDCRVVVTGTRVGTFIILDDIDEE
ncbi:MAG: hypothetical protein KAY32_07560 [Candidatus Eisenbacteria sp.]|nr:hypothetical protein [Candidatus Eisenbacteria bacterium]